MRLTFTNPSSFLLFAASMQQIVQWALAAKILFIGDSMTDRAGEAPALEERCLASWVINEGISGSTVRQWLTNDQGSFLTNILQANEDAKSVWVSLGANDLLYSNCEKSVANVARDVREVVSIVAERLPAASILLNSYMIPSCEVFEDAPDCKWSILGDMAVEYQAIADDYPKVTFVNHIFLFGGTLTTPSDPQYFADCIHLNTAGYLKLLDHQPFFDAICPPDDGSTPGKKDSSRRRLMANGFASVLEPQSELYHSLLEKCSSYKYNVSLYVDVSGHLYAIAHPSENALASGCPFGATHAVMLGDGAPRKEIIFWADAREGQAQFAEESSLYIGSFQLHDLHRAFQRAHAGAAGGAVYNVVTNNCGAYLVNLATQLGIKIDSHITSFVARRLLVDSAQQLGNMIRNSLHYNTLFDRSLRGTAAAMPTDEELVKMLVCKSASQLEQ